MKTFMLLVAIAFTNFTMPAWANEPAESHDMSKMNMNASKEDREKMAKMHEQMATCLRSDQELAQCRDAVHKDCQSMMGGACPEMGMGMGMGKGMHRKMKHGK